MNPSDQELLTKFVTHGEESAFEALVKRYSSMVMGVCRRVLDTHDASDAFQAVFVIVAKKATDLQSQASIASWLYRVALNTSLNLKKSNLTRTTLHEPLEEEVHTTNSQAEDRLWAEIRPEIDQELDRLAEKHRAPIVLCYLQGMSYEEAGHSLNLSSTTVKKRLDHSRNVLKDRFTRRGLILSSVVLAGLLTKNSSAAVPDLLIHSTSQMANPLAFGKISATGALSPKIVSLAEGIMKAMFIQKLKTTVAVAVLAISTGTVIPVVFQRVLANPPSPTISKQVKAQGVLSKESSKISSPATNESNILFGVIERKDSNGVVLKTDDGKTEKYWMWNKGGMSEADLKNSSVKAGDRVELRSVLIEERLRIVSLKVINES